MVWGWLLSCRDDLHPTSPVQNLSLLPPSQASALRLASDRPAGTQAKDRKPVALSWRGFVCFRRNLSGSLHGSGTGARLQDLTYHAVQPESRETEGDRGNRDILPLNSKASGSNHTTKQPAGDPNPSGQQHALAIVFLRIRPIPFAASSPGLSLHRGLCALGPPPAQCRPTDQPPSAPPLAAPCPFSRKIDAP